MQVSVLTSGSKGNSCYVKAGNHNILIDVGSTCLYVEKALKDLGINPHIIDSVFITHTHVDHISGLKVFLKKYNPKVYLSSKMLDELSEIMTITNYSLIESDLTIDDITVTPFKTSHDTDDSQGYVIEYLNQSLVYVTDTGYINVRYQKLLADRTIYVIESNHDIEMLMNNPNYPYHTKQRILGDKGHLSNSDSAYYLSEFIGSHTKHVVLAHLSEHNNTKELALQTLKDVLSNKNKQIDDIQVALQNKRTDMIEV